MKTDWIAAGMLLAALASHGAPAPALVVDKDTVAGIAADPWLGKDSWLEPEFIRVRNASGRAVSFDSLRLPSGTIGSEGSYIPLKLVFAVRRHVPGNPVTKYLNTDLKSMPIELAAGDSIDLGLFEIGRIVIPVKSSAAPGPRRYQPGDSILAPLSLLGGTDSIAFVLKARVRNIAFGYGGVVVRIGRRSSPARGRTVTLDGRAASPARPVARILFR